MSDQQQGVEITIPVGLTAARIQCANPEYRREGCAMILRSSCTRSSVGCGSFYTAAPGAIERVAARGKRSTRTTHMMRRSRRRMAGRFRAPRPTRASGSWNASEASTLSSFMTRYLALCCKITPSLEVDLDGLGLGLSGGRA